LGRPRRSHNAAPPKLRVAKFERLKFGFSLQVVSDRTGIPIYLLSDFERGTKLLDEIDLASLARVYNYADPNALTLEAVIVAKGVPA
jgi:transcriptional regulator with XRE-family HTH domain